MPTTSYHLLDTLQLSDQLVWSDEFAWSPRAQTLTTGLTGKPVIQSGTRIGGRPITLKSFAADQGLVFRDTLLALYALAEAPDATYVLTLADGRSYTVRFRPGAEISAMPLHHIPTMPSDLAYQVEIPLMTV